jgi:tetratricopeptide (TPR) repeat protein
LLGPLGFGCGRQAPPAADESGNTTPNRANTSAPVDAGASKALDPSAYIPPDLTKEDKQNAALLDAVSHLAERRYVEALAALEFAKSIQDTEQVRQEIVRVKLRLEREAAAQRTAQDIQIVLKDGKPEDAARLATGGLQQFGDSDAADQLARLKRQADALIAAQGEDQLAKRARFRAEAEAAVREKNIRAAAIAFEQALALGDDPTLRAQYDQIRGSLNIYDEKRRQAAELRRDPYQLEDAIVLYEQASQAWDTLQVRQELDECRLALQRRRDRIAVADFDIRGDIGIPAAGRTIAEELLPSFKTRFDIVERTQLSKVLAELKLEASELAENDGGRRQVGELAKVRYLVLGSVTRVSGVLLSARLVDVRTGLVVQTAKLPARSPEELFARLPQLAALLMMNDEQRLAHEQHFAHLPLPGPSTAVDGRTGSEILAFSHRPPDLGGIRIDDFDRLPPPPPAGLPPGLSVDLALPLKDKFLGLSLELGDDLFRRGRYLEAVKHFEFAYALYPERDDLRLRLDRCRPHLPSPPHGTPSAPIAIGGRPRLAIVNFPAFGDVPPGLGPWTAEQIAPYFCPPYEVVDRGEVFWWMGRLGLTIRDLMQDPAARRYLGRALEVRYFLVGAIRQTASFDVATHLLDAENGFRVGGARLHVHDQRELKLRLGELARLTLMDPRERERFEREGREYDRIVLEGKQRFQRGEFAIALELFGQAKKHRPFSVQVQVLVDECDVRSRQAAIEEARRREFERAQALAAEVHRRQVELARQAEAARIQAEQEAAALAEAARRLHEEQRRRAHAQLLGQARIALQGKNFSLSIQLFESASSLRPSEDLYRELALARAQAAEETRRAEAAEQALREAAARRRRDEQLAQARAQVEEVRRRRDDEEQARLAAQQARDQEEYAKLLDAAQRLQAQQKFDQVVTALQSARRLRKTEEVERLLQGALVEQARAAAAKKDTAARAELEQKLAEEKLRREAAEAEARRNQELYTAALAAARQATADKRFEVAIARYHEAGKIFKTDEVLNGLKQVEEARVKETAVRDAILKREAEAAKKEAEFKRLMTEGQTALAGQQFARAVTAFKQATQLKPADVDALAALSKAEQARDEFQALQARKREASDKARQDAAAAAVERERRQREQARLEREESERRDDERKKATSEFNRLMTRGSTAVVGKHYDDAVKAYSEALRIRPDDATAKRALQNALAAQESAKRSSAATRPEPPQKSDPLRPKPTDPIPGEPAKKEPTPPQKKPDLQTKPSKPAPAEYTTQISAGTAAEKEKKWADAVAAYSEALRLVPGDKTAAAALKGAQFQFYMSEGQKAFDAKRYPRAVQLFEQATKLDPKNEEAAEALERARKSR